MFYKDETHYFVMTAKKESLLTKGVLKENCNTTAELLSSHNVDILNIKRQKRIEKKEKREREGIIVLTK